MRARVSSPDLSTPMMVVVMIMTILFGLVSMIARHIDLDRTALASHSDQ